MGTKGRVCFQREGGVLMLRKVAGGFEGVYGPSSAPGSPAWPEHWQQMIASYEPATTVLCVVLPEREGEFPEMQVITSEAVGTA